MRALALVALLTACPEPNPAPDGGDYHMERVREWRLDCEHGRGPNPECPMEHSS